ncbi:MAG: metallophosphoesterase [Erysipelotrichaceae bacterium]|nr:metallophosphoesterase [Erysipelotrichaceae bacterium]
MHYVISDIHGCYKEFLELIDRIGLKDSDDLYILGDSVDRGPEPIALLQDLMLRPNVYPLTGNHEYMALEVLQKLTVEITEENAESWLKEEDLTSYVHWISDGGAITVDQYSSLPLEEKEDILDYLQEGQLYADLSVNGKRFILVHAGIDHFDPLKDLDDYGPEDLIFHRVRREGPYFADPDTFVIIGHTPTKSLRKDKMPLIFEQDQQIYIDCGCIFGGNLCAYCLETGEAVYVPRRKDPA